MKGHFGEVGLVGFCDLYYIVMITFFITGIVGQDLWHASLFGGKLLLYQLIAYVVVGFIFLAFLLCFVDIVKRTKMDKIKCILQWIPFLVILMLGIYI